MPFAFVRRRQARALVINEVHAERVRAQRQLDYVTSAQMLGLGPIRTLCSEILPNVAPLLITLFTLEMGVAIVVDKVLG